MSVNKQRKGKRALRITLGWNAGSSAFDSAGNAVPGATTFQVPGLVGDWTEDWPDETQVDPLEQGEVVSDAAPILVDDQFGSGSFSQQYTEETDAAQLALLDIIRGTGFASTLPSVITGSEIVYCDIKREYIHPGDSTSHGIVIEQCRLTHSKATGDPVINTINWGSRTVRPTKVW